MIARGFKPVAWVAAIGTAALSCYMLSLQVAAERAELASLERRIVRTHQDIRSLQTELGTRGRLQQLEHWNAEVLALSAPVAGQFLESGLTLARFDTREAPGQVHEQVRLASADTAATAPAAAPQPAVVQARAPSPAERPVAVEPPLVRRASLEIAPAAKPASLRPAVTQVRAAAPASARPKATQARATAPASLLDEGTLREIGAQAESEQGRN
jgi:hypothetical protein